MHKTTAIIAVTVYNLIIMSGTAYIVFWLGHSGWWFLLSYLFLMRFKD